MSGTRQVFRLLLDDYISFILTWRDRNLPFQLVNITIDPNLTQHIDSVHSLYT